MHQQALAQHEVQRAQIEQRRQLLAERHAQESAPLADMEQALALAREQQAVSEAALGQARQAQQQVQDACRKAQEALVVAERALDSARQVVEARRLQVQALALRMEAPAAVLAAAGEEVVASALRACGELSLEAVQARLEGIRTRIARLGAVNLAALEEFEEARRRKEEWDAQQADLNESLTNLEAAMAKMDRETRARFRATYETVNRHLAETFQQLFGGGEAYLSLTEPVRGSESEGEGSTADPWLNGGVALMARPPGKKVSHIHLLSGGEKSLTAIALVFAIFRLNPAPFCLLDEVDAPLDEANVGRFCAMVRAMSERVQFIFITHNKTTMELARQLVGVTMREPGVSRIVDVDLDAAVQLVDNQALA